MTLAEHGDDEFVQIYLYITSLYSILLFSFLQEPCWQHPEKATLPMSTRGSSQRKHCREYELMFKTILFLFDTFSLIPYEIQRQFEVICLICSDTNILHDDVAVNVHQLFSVGKRSCYQH